MHIPTLEFLFLTARRQEQNYLSFIYQNHRGKKPDTISLSFTVVMYRLFKSWPLSVRLRTVVQYAEFNHWKRKNYPLEEIGRCVI